MKSLIFKKAWQIAKKQARLERHYGNKNVKAYEFISDALKLAWAIYKQENGKNIVHFWFASKYANVPEKFSNEQIVRETEKAVLVRCATPNDFHEEWIPKSCVDFAS